MKKTLDIYKPSMVDVEAAAARLRGVALQTPLMPNFTYSNLYNANILLKREDLQQVRSYKIRGAYNKISSLSDEEKQRGVVCVSAGNHAQGVALSCAKLGIQGTIFMPSPTPKQKVQQVAMFGADAIQIELVGDTFDDAYEAAIAECERLQKVFVHPFNDEKVIEGQATVSLEILEQTTEPIDYVFVPVGGGGLISGLSTMFHLHSPNTKIIGVEPEGAPSMKTSLEQGELVTLPQIDKFVDGAAV